MDWKKYEEFVFENIEAIFPEAECIFNSKILGKYSKGMRQCDILIKNKIYGKENIILIDAKYYSKKVDVKNVEEFIAMVSDVNADEGILITQNGYTKSAYERAQNDPSQILLDILTINDLKQYQGYGAIAYAGNNGVLLMNAFGWVIDITKKFDCLAFSYRKGFDFEKAWNEKEFIYFNLWDTKIDKISKIELLEKQTKLLAEQSEIVNSKIDVIECNGKELAIRKTKIKNYLAPEYACAVEYEGFIFFGIMISENRREKVNLSKLIHMISRTRPIKIKNGENK